MKQKQNKTKPKQNKQANKQTNNTFTTVKCTVLTHNSNALVEAV